MKITKTQLKQIIKEEFEAHRQGLEEAEEPSNAVYFVYLTRLGNEYLEYASGNKQLAKDYYDGLAEKYITNKNISPALRMLDGEAKDDSGQSRMETLEFQGPDQKIKYSR